MLAEKFSIVFMNFGFLPLNDEDKEKLQIVEKSSVFPSEVRAHVYLYEKCLSMCPLYPAMDGLKLLEVGCGQGGGIKWFSSAYPNLKKVQGIDRVVANSMGGKIVPGDATDIPLPDASFDLIVNVESSHLYSDKQKFFDECARVLVKGGHLCWVDVRFKDLVDETLEQARSAGLKRVAFADITAEALAGVAETSRRYDALLEQAPWFVRLFRNSIRTTYCAPGTATYENYATRRKVYVAACWQKV
uniref:Methyltransferase type 11 domain-containing protein n=1 Tax=Plectus sambesii TaxID=2011161 RepID=A0A914X664_9BILA